MAEHYEMPHMDNNKERGREQKTVGTVPGYTKNSVVLLMFALMLTGAFVLSVGTGFVVFFLAEGNKEIKVVFPENYSPTCQPQTSGPEDTTDVLPTTSKPPGETVTDRGAVYTRWGRTVCPTNSSTLYTGYTAGSYYSHSGGMVNTLCLPMKPQWGKFHSGTQSSYIYSAEYNDANTRYQSIFGKTLLDQDVPCVVCQSIGRPTLMMIPALTECFDGWFLEYSGYMMTSHHDHSKSDVKCLDNDPEALVGQSASTGGLLFYFVEAQGQIPDPPYVRERELTCVVCTQ